MLDADIPNMDEEIVPPVMTAFAALEARVRFIETSLSRLAPIASALAPSIAYEIADIKAASTTVRTASEIADLKAATRSWARAASAVKG